MLELRGLGFEKSYIKGLTTNPTLMKKVGITDYRAFCKDILESINEKPLSFDGFFQMASI